MKEFLKHELKALSNGLENLFNTLFDVYRFMWYFGTGLIVFLVTIACVVGILPIWVFFIEILVALGFVAWRRYKKFKSEESD